MNRILLVVAALVALSVVAAVMLLSDGEEAGPAAGAAPLSVAEDAPRPPAPLGAAASEVDVAPLRPRLDVAPSTADEALAAHTTDAAAAHLQGSLRLTDGTPVGGVRLQLALHPTDSELPLLPAPETTVDDTGHYHFELALDAPHRLVALTVQPGTRVPRQRHEIGQPLQPGQTLEHDLTVTPGVTLAGTVVDADGQPVADAEVLGWTGQRWMLDAERLADPDRVTRTDDLGRFQLSGLGSPWLLEPRAAGLTARARLHGELAPGGSLDGLTLTLAPARRLTGRVLGAGAQPVADATVKATLRLVGASATVTEHERTYLTAPRPREQSTGADGRFDLGPLPDVVHRIDVEHPEHPSWEGRHGPDDGELVIELEPGVSLSGRVLAHDGRPLAGATLALESSNRFSGGGNQRRTTSDQDGRFTFHGLQADADNWLLAYAPGHAVHVEQPVVIAAQGNPELRVVLAPARRLAGQVVDADGAAVADAHVAIEGDRLIDHGNVTMAPLPTWERQVPALVSTRTDADGRFAFDDLYDGVFSVEASDGSGLRSTVETRSGDERILLVLDPDAVVGVTLVGTAIDASTGLPVSDFRITPMIPAANGGMTGMSETFSDAEGRWRLPGLDAGPMLVTAQATGYAPWSHELVDYLEGEHHIDVAFAPTRSVRFVVVDTQGAPTSAMLTFADKAGRSLMVESGPGSAHSLLRTDDAGRALAAGLPAEPLVVTTRRDYLSPSCEHHVDLTLAPGGPVELVHDGPAEQDISVVVLAGVLDDPASLAQDGWMALSAATEALEAGQLRAPAGPVSLQAIDAEGHTVQPGADAAADPRVPERLAPHAQRLHLDARREWTIQASTPAGASANRSWQPAGGLGSEIIVLLLPEG